MILSRRTVLSLGFCFCFILFYTARCLSQSWSDVPQAVGLGEIVWSHSVNANSSNYFNITVGHGVKNLHVPHPNFIPGTPKPLGSQYSKMLVIPRLKTEDVDWIERELPGWGTAIYTADDPHAPLHPPKNKGHEVMIYLTFVVDFYDELPDIAVFLHAHQTAWHNDAIFNQDAAEMLRRLSMDRVTREGYMNLRCTTAPGCPDWMHPGAVLEDESKQEEVLLARAWSEIFPDEPVPSVLAQPCCAQFAVSSERIRTIPRSRFIFYRDWLLQTQLSDYIAGRIWEYLWQYVFTGNSVVCIEESVCLCDGYGVCFGGPSEYQAFIELQESSKRLKDEVDDWSFLELEMEQAEKERLNAAVQQSDSPDHEMTVAELAAHQEQAVSDAIANALDRGKDPRIRALEAGRPWKEGDSF
ncbi:hypothetical protein N7495_004614 [Penicillium taxi]|uniref:uncharacterized protein n=1 Tax=Penicillium taxi TaxID=168475 RepID=UPI00254579AB|nr:uncharacterized protein N7495_004614 [Penicillium taxi]KAJ5899870.1 hypothetical protein N7495_004614 [Penicillium taxi]